MNKITKYILTITFTSLLFPATLFACACGCNVFSIGARWMMPSSEGYRMYLLYNFMDQAENWSNWQSAASSLNDDKEIRTSFYALGFQYMADRDWGFMVEAPVWDRYFRTTDDAGDIASVNHSSIGDVRLLGISEDMSTGIQFGLKLPTGAFNQSLLDRDTQIGTGTTDLLLGGYQMGQENSWGWYTQVLWQRALNMRDGYRPGDSFDLTVGVHYDNLLRRYKIVPTLQLIASFRGEDSGPNSDPANTGYDRLYISPSIEVTPIANFSFYADLRIPVATYTRGYQLVAPPLISFTAEYDF
jgi:hypothetical protein